MSETDKQILARIAQHLERLGKNDAWLGRKLGAHKNTVSGWKDRGVPASRYTQIADLFGLSLEELVYGKQAAKSVPAKTEAQNAGLSPVAQSLGTMLDEITDEKQRMRCYAMAIQLFTLSSNAPMPFAPAPRPPAGPRCAPAVQPMLWPA